MVVVGMNNKIAVVVHMSNMEYTQLKRKHVQQQNRSDTVGEVVIMVVRQRLVTWRQ